MARKNTSSRVETSDYRHTGDKRKNIPPAKIAAEGEVPQFKKVKYHYSPHLSPELLFDSTGKADRVMEAKKKADQYLTEPERQILDQALTNQQPWLEWAAKKEQHDRGSFEVDPVALHIHERVSAQAIVRAAMREDAQRELFADPQLPYQKEVQFYRHDIDWANRLILGDSLQVMSSLSRRENLTGKVQMIYMDPPYGIKFGSNFQPAVGNRDVSDREDDISREPETVKAYRDTWNLGVHSYLSYLRDRFIVARELLSPTGGIFVQISDENLHRARTLLDEVFGAHNFVSAISYLTTSGHDSNFLANVTDFILFYARDLSRLNFHTLYGEKVLGSEKADKYRNADATDGSPRILSEDGNNAELRIWTLGDLTSKGWSERGSQPIDFRNIRFDCPSNSHWKTNAEGIARLSSAERLTPTGKRLMFKRFLNDFAVYPINNQWTDTSSGFSLKDPKVYAVQTRPLIITRCLLMVTKPGDIVLDPTCGSGTTAYVAEQWGRRWITIDTSRVALAITRQRLLTAKYDYYLLRAQENGVSGNFVYKSVPHITLKSIAKNQNLDPIFAKHELILNMALADCNKSLLQISDLVRDKCRRKHMEKQASEGKRAVTNADRRRWELPKKGEKWEHWEVPFDTDSDWPKPLQETVTTYRKAWRAKMDEVNACIAQNAEQEELVDQPEVVKGIVRVSGPFTVEGVRPEELSLSEDGLFDATPNEWEGEGPSDVRDDVQNLRAYLSRMVDLIRKDGVTFIGNKNRKFARVDPLFEEKTGTFIHAASVWEGADLSEPNTIAIAFGPQYGPITAQQVEDIIRGSKRYDELIIAGFSFDAEASVAIQESSHPKLKIHMAHIRPDVSPGMDGLLKDTPNSQLFTVFGQPEVKVKKHGKEEYQVELLGVDVFDPLKGEVMSTGAEKVAAWFLDSDYDGRCFCVTQAFFPDQAAWDKIAKALGAQADEEAFASFAGTASLPFKPGKYKRIAVKVIDPRGNEVMAFKKLEN